MDERGEEGGMVWTRVLRAGFEDLRDSLTACERKSSAEDLREERSLFSIALLSPLFGIRSGEFEKQKWGEMKKPFNFLFLGTMNRRVWVGPAWL